MPSATLAANGGTGNLLLGTTYSTNGFILNNTSADGAGIARVVLRMVPTLLPDLVFDPKTDTDGLAAGDSLNKDFTRDPGSIGTFGVTPTLTEAFSGGYRTLTLDFVGFDPGERLAFSIDQDPISIKGGGREDASNAGAIVGLELIGMAITVTYTDGTVQEGELFSDGSPGGAISRLQSGLVAAPTLSVAGVAGATALVDDLTQTVTLSGGSPFGKARLLIVEGGQYAVPGNGYVFGTFEANKAIASASRIVDLDANGAWTGTVTLTDGAGPTDGISHLLAAMVDASGRVIGLVSDAVVLKVVGPPNEAPVLAAPIADQRAIAGASFDFALPPGTFTDADAGDTLTLAATGLPGGITFDAATGAFGGVAPQVGVFTVVVTASDALGATASDAFTLAVALGLTDAGETRIGGSGVDVVAAGGGADSLDGGGGNDWLWGDAGNDTVAGAGGNDVLFGGDGADLVRGGGGNDTLVGGAGADRLAGNAGADVFRFASATEGGDTLLDFVGGTDRLEVSAAGFGGGLVAGEALSATGRFVANATGAATTAGLAQFAFATGSGTLFWDADGAGGAAGVIVARLGAASLAAADIAVIA